MNIYFDCEFTGLRKNTTLISLGLVSDDDKKFYAEFTDYNQVQCDQWIQENVIDKLIVSDPVSDVAKCILYDKDATYVNGTTSEIREKLEEFLSQYDNVQLVSDVCHYDMVLFIDIFGTAFKLPSNVSPSCHDINQDIALYYGISEKEAFDKSRISIINKITVMVDFPIPEKNQHNALFDAMAIKDIYGYFRQMGILSKTIPENFIKYCRTDC